MTAYATAPYATSFPVLRSLPVCGLCGGDKAVGLLMCSGCHSIEAGRPDSHSELTRHLLKAERDLGAVAVEAESVFAPGVEP